MGLKSFLFVGISRQTKKLSLCALCVSVVKVNNFVLCLIIWGKPIGEAVAWYGPIVMNTQEELRIAFEEYQNGTFIKPGK